MKKRIITITLALVLAFNFLAVRPRAAGAVVAIGSIGVAAYFLLMTMIENSDEYDRLLESGVDAFTNPDSTFQTEYVAKWYDGWDIIRNKLTDWVDDYTVSVTDDGKVSLSYSQYLDLCDLVGQAGASNNITLNTDIPHLFFKAEPGITYNIDYSISVNSDEEMTYGMSYIPVYYTADKLYLCSNSAYIRYLVSKSYNETYLNASQYYVRDNDYGYQSHDNMFDGYYGGNKLYKLIDLKLSICSTNTKFTYSSNWNNKNVSKTYAVNWFETDGKTISKCSSPDLSGCSFGYICCRGTSSDFFKTVTEANITAGTADIDDLSKVLPLDKTKNPTLEVDTDPAITNPNDAVTVKDVPGQADMTLTELKANTRLDLDIPSMIATKFPFCIPFDFIRIIGVFCADPKTPVFRIPISTDPSQMEAFKGNQTIGEIPEDFEPMFEIDEELVIDLSVIPLVQPICYTVFIVGFVLLLIHITPKMINH